MENSITHPLVGKTIREARATSYFIGEEQICEITSVFLATTDNLWFKLNVMDGEYNILQTTEPELVTRNAIDDEFASPVKALPLPPIPFTITGIQAYLWQGQEDECGGLYLETMEGPGFSLLEKEDCCVFIPGLHLTGDFELVGVVHP